jgi:tetratricopeptide (TPR) repeat protein
MRVPGGRSAAWLVCAALVAAPPWAAADEPPHATPLPASVPDWAAGAQLYAGLGDFHRAVTTSSAEAQAYFDQGMRLLWAFNHDEATRSFARAAVLDPGCAACYWGVALSVGPNYNYTHIAAARAAFAFAALQSAREHEATAAPVERDLIEALSARFPDPGAPDHAQGAARLAAYAQAMRSLAARYPADDDVQVLGAEAAMTVHAWKLWTSAGAPVEGTAEVEARLETVLARNPQHPGANHYYVHVMEASPTPGKALAAAERLRGMMPAAGHLEHMPAHIMQRVGRYEDAAEANRQGIRADRAYLASTAAPDHYEMYLVHNSVFLAYAAAMEGRKAETLAATQDVSAALPVPMLIGMGDSGWGSGAAYAALVRFGLWDELIALGPPDARLPGARAAYLYGRGFALAARGNLAPAREALAALQGLKGNVSPDMHAGENRLVDVIAVAEPVVAARIAATEYRNEEAVKLLTEATAAEDALAYDEPADWFFPVRQLLGAQLLLMGEPQAAAAVYREDLRRNPDNGWSLMGLAQALTLEGRRAEGARVAQAQARAWSHADVRLPTSAFWYAGADAASCECQHFSSLERQPRGELLGAQHEAGVD